MDTDEKANGEAKPPAPKTRKVKKQVRKGDLPLSAGTHSLAPEVKDKYNELENQMIAEDKLVADTEDKKNELESEIYAMRNKIDEPYESNGYADFASEDEKSAVKAKCESLEDWLYDEGEDASKGQYIAKMDELRASAGPIIQRFNDKRQEEEEARRKVIEEAAAKKRAEEDAKRKAEEEKKKAEEEAKKAQQAEKKDEEMTDVPADADGQKPADVEEA